MINALACDFTLQDGLLRPYKTLYDFEEVDSEPNLILIFDRGELIHARWNGPGQCPPGWYVLADGALHRLNDTDDEFFDYYTPKDVQEVISVGSDGDIYVELEPIEALHFYLVYGEDYTKAKQWFS